MTRREYCEKHNLPVTTFDYWRHVRKSKPRLVEVAVETQPATGFALVLRQWTTDRKLVSFRQSCVGVFGGEEFK